MNVNKYKIPFVYQEMEKRGYTNAQSDSYLWLNEMEWIPVDLIKNYKYDEGETDTIIPFAFTGGGDKWVWIFDDCKEYAVGLCENAEVNGIYYAENTQDALLRNIIEFVADSNFYINKEDAESYQISEEELKKQLYEWKNRLKGIICDQYIQLIDELSKLNLKHIKCQYGEWYALLSLEEKDDMIKKYIMFDLMDEEFEWYCI